jgi:hypothetical protein
MNVIELDPLTDPRWPAFVEQHPASSIFHTREWLRVLHFSYGYKPVVFATHGVFAISDAVVFCEIKSWLTGSRLVSLPFSDHCQPLADRKGLQEILSYLDQRRRASGLKYVELRPAAIEGTDAQGSFSASERFLLQKIDLRQSLDSIYGGLHSSCIRRKIKRAEREDLVYESGQSEAILLKFRELLLLTRRRHKLPPQPATWFQNIVECLGDKVTVHLLSKDGSAVASIMTFAHKQVLTYKYGCSDASFNNLGGTPLLFWKVIQQAHAAGMEDFDLGRSGFEDPGLITFKEHLGARSVELVYLRNPLSKPNSPETFPETRAWARQALTQLPDPLFTGLGRLLYRHMG